MLGSAGRGFVFAAALLGVLATLRSAVHTFVLPRASPVAISRVVFMACRAVLALLARPARPYRERDRVMALYAPVALLMLPVTWLALVGSAGTAMFWALGAPGLATAARLSGSSLLTLGFERPRGASQAALSFGLGLVGLGLIALLISYLPTMYSAFARREATVTLVASRADSPPSAVKMIERFHLIGGIEQLDGMWRGWEAWFADIEESHTSLSALSLFRSPRPDRSWVTAAGAVLDAGGLRAALLDLPRSADAELCVRAGFLALRAVADFFAVPYDPDPRPDDPISVSREEFDAACDRLAGIGVPLRSDRDAAWAAFAGWRVNYDTVLLALASITMAPEAPWSSDRAPRYVRPPLLRRPRPARARR